MGGWTGIGKDTIEWDGDIRAKRFIGQTAGGTITETDPIFQAWLLDPVLTIPQEEQVVTGQETSVLLTDLSDFAITGSFSQEPVWFGDLESIGVEKEKEKDIIIPQETLIGFDNDKTIIQEEKVLREIPDAEKKDYVLQPDSIEIGKLDGDLNLNGDFNLFAPINKRGQ